MPWGQAPFDICPLYQTSSATSRGCFVIGSRDRPHAIRPACKLLRHATDQDGHDAQAPILLRKHSWAKNSPDNHALAIGERLDVRVAELGLGLEVERSSDGLQMIRAATRTDGRELEDILRRGFAMLEAERLQFGILAREVGGEEVPLVQVRWLPLRSMGLSGSEIQRRTITSVCARCHSQSQRLLA